MEKNYKQQWEAFREEELIKINLLLNQLGFSLDKKQVHIGGERYLFGGKKLVLLGSRDKDNKKVIIKVSRDREMIAEIEDEIKSREILKKINFAYHVFNFPREILHVKKQDYIIFITEFIDQKCTFLARPLQEQFFIALKAFESQEAIHATTYEHANVIRNVFGVWQASDYLQKADIYIEDIQNIFPDQGLAKNLQKAKQFLHKNTELIDAYSNFLTHWDFVPHNFRVSGHDIYLLDHSSLRFGNKHEGWARFLNFMTLYNHDLETVLLTYIQNNRDQSEHHSLRAMRIFRLLELIWHYVSTLDKAEGNLKILNKKRIYFWDKVLASVLENRDLEQSIVEEYKQARDSLRSDEEKARQEKLH